MRLIDADKLVERILFICDNDAFNCTLIGGLVLGVIDGQPTIEVPTPHGRLIDADEVPYFASSPWKSITTQSEIEKMPTIIEAEEGEEE